jgi:hypothetical protein
MSSIKVILDTIELVYKQHSRSDRISISVGDLVDLRSCILGLEKTHELLRQQLKYSETRRKDNIALYESMRVTSSFDSFKLDTNS